MNKNIQKQNKEIGMLMKDFVTHTVNFYNHLDEQPVCHPIPPQTITCLEKQTIPAQSRPVQEVYTEMLRDIYSNAASLQHPRSFSCIPSTASLLSWMGDVMTNTYNPHASCEINAPAADLVEKKLIRWMCDLVGYPEESGGLFLSGGSISNLTALTAARDAKLTYEERKDAVIYVSDQTHSSVAKGLHIIGFQKEQLRIISTDQLFRMDISALQAAIENDWSQGRKPFAIIASVGTTNTGSIDPLLPISELCRKYNMWMHVDGAFGASSLLSEKYRKELAGIEFSDSLSWDAHKWLLQTYGCSMVLVRDRSFLSNTFSAHPEYLKDSEVSEGSIEFWDLGPELTRPARGLKLWLTLQAMGTDKIEEIIDHGCDLAKLAENILAQNPDWEIICPAQLGIINFRYKGTGNFTDKELDLINQKLAREITNSGFAQIFTTQLKGIKVLRMCIIHPETTEKDIYDTLERLMHSHLICPLKAS